jgi:hypothetical protein
MRERNRSPLEGAIFFRTVEEFCRRSGFELRIQCATDELDFIVGKYVRPRNNQIECGLNGCTHAHMYGYVIRAKDGRETNCGKDCGAREFGIQFQEFEAEYKKAEDMQLRRELLGQVLIDREALLKSGHEVVAQVKKAAFRVSRVMKEVHREGALTRVLEACIRAGGLIRVEDRVDEAIRRSKADLKTIGEIRGGAVIAQHSQIPNEVYYRVVRALERIDLTELEQLDSTALEKKSRELADIGDIVRRAQQFLKDEKRFTTHANLMEMMKLKELIPKSGRKDRLDRILIKLPDLLD